MIINPIYKTIFINICNGMNSHGSFLRAFAQTYILADSENLEILYPVAEKLIVKYDLYNKPYIEVHNG